MDKFQNKYRIPSSRLQLWDYRWAATYFITICTEERKKYFGEINIDDNCIQLSQVGVIADILWHQIPVHSKGEELGSFVVMPNNIHGILILPDNDHDTNTANAGPQNVEARHALSDDPDNPIKQHSLSDNHQKTHSSPNIKTVGQSRFQHIGKKSVSSIVGSYKSAVTKHANRLKYNFKWQSSFYDHIIRNDYNYQRISNYIDTNPANWEKDKFFNC